MKSAKIRRPADAPPSTSTVDAIEGNLVALAEQLGRLVGTVQARTDGLFDRYAVNEQLARIRDGASGLLGQLSQTAEPDRPATKRKAKAKSAGRAENKAVAQGRTGGGPVSAPGKAHRKAPPRTRTIKHSDQAVAKAKAARRTRRAPRG
jgi:hypothetical protein